MALRRRINLFESVVGPTQPILANMSSFIARHILERRNTDPDARAKLVGDLERDTEAAKHDGLDLDAILDADLEEPKRPPARLTLADLDLVLNAPDVLPPGFAVTKLQDGEYALSIPGKASSIRVTTHPDYFEDHSDSLELWFPGNPSFPEINDVTPAENLETTTLSSML